MCDQTQVNVRNMISSKSQRWLGWRPGSLAKNGGVLLGWMLLRTATQTSTIFLLARQLGAHNYGQVVAVIAMASFLVPVAGLGLSHIVLRNASRDPTHEPVYFARALHWWWRTLLPSVAAAIAVAIMLLPNTLVLVAMCTAIASEIAATSMTELRARHRQAQHRMHAFGAINAGLPLCRLLAVGLLLLLNHTPTASAVLWVYATSGLLYLAFLWRAVPSNTRLAQTSAPETMTTTSGLPFSLAVLAAKLQAEFNKPILA